MNLKERKMVHRIYEALNAVPGAYIGGGIKTTTVTGVVNFGADMREIRNHCNEALVALFDGALTPLERDTDYNAAIEKAESFIKARKATDWKAR